MLSVTRYRNLLAPGALVLLSLAAVWSWSAEGIVYQLCRTDIDSVQRMDGLKAFFAEFGMWAPLVYLVMVTVEVVVAPLPGLMLYAPGGILFGPLVGGAMALGGNIIGAGIACLVTRSLGASLVERFFSRDQWQRIYEAVDQRGPLLIFLLRVNPLTSSDVVSYAAGLTPIPVWKVMLATGLAMAPLCFAQAWLAEGLLTAFPQLIYPLIICCLIYLIAVMLVVRKMVRQPAST